MGKSSQEEPADYLAGFEQDPAVPPLSWVVGAGAEPEAEGDVNAISPKQPSEMSDEEKFDDEVKDVLKALRG